MLSCTSVWHFQSNICTPKDISAICKDIVKNG